MMTEQETRAIVREAVRETLISLGIDSDDHTGLQQDMAFLRSWRESTSAIKRQGLLTAVGVIVIGFLGLLVASFFQRPP
ncbi:MAG: hypothetical protein NUV34_06225 [Sulfuricaulis sp.]|nr:hypothetical protein [Sulfuricaulis sp.]